MGRVSDCGDLCVLMNTGSMDFVQNSFEFFAYSLKLAWGISISWLLVSFCGILSLKYKEYPFTEEYYGVPF